MARGWESKSVEAQIETVRAPRQRKGELSREQMDAVRKVDALLLHRTRVLRDLESCREARYEKTLRDGLAYLENQLTELGWRP